MTRGRAQIQNGALDHLRIQVCRLLVKNLMFVFLMLGNNLNADDVGHREIQKHSFYTL